MPQHDDLGFQPCPRPKRRDHDVEDQAHERDHCQSAYLILFLTPSADGVFAKDRRIATEYMVNLMHGHTITCEARTKDRYGRTVALCWADGVDIEAEMVRAGMALAFVRYSRDYAELESQARAEGLGMHAHQCEKPWEWRARLSGR